MTMTPEKACSQRRPIRSQPGAALSQVRQRKGGKNNARSTRKGVKECCRSKRVA